MVVLYLIFILLVIVPWYYKTKQVKQLHSYYQKFLKSGHVIVERKRSFFSGAILILQLDTAANIKDCILLTGATFFSPWRQFEEVIGKNLLNLREEELHKYQKNVQKVFRKAIQSYNKSNMDALVQNMTISK